MAKSKLSRLNLKLINCQVSVNYFAESKFILLWKNAMWWFMCINICAVKIKVMWNWLCNRKRVIKLCFDKTGTTWLRNLTIRPAVSREINPLFEIFQREIPISVWYSYCLFHGLWITGARFNCHNQNYNLVQPGLFTFKMKG